MSTKQHTPRQKFTRYLAQMLRWQDLPRDSAERAEAVRMWLAQGQHTGGKPPVRESTKTEGQRIKEKRDRWKFRWRHQIRNDPELTKLAVEAGVLDKPRPDALPGDFANPDPRVYRVIVRPPPPKDEKP